AGQHTLALTSDGRVVAWGDDNSYGQITVPPGLTDVIAVSVGFSHSLALKADGTAVAWGYNHDGQGSVPSNVSHVSAISAKANHNLVLAAAPSITILADPQNVLTNVGATVSFMVTAIGSEPLSYQWQKKGTNLAGATSSNLNLTNTVLSDAGNYA